MQVEVTLIYISRSFYEDTTKIAINLDVCSSAQDSYRRLLVFLSFQGAAYRRFFHNLAGICDDGVDLD
jgi:hypothetical protein